jgi:arylformamidase
MSSLIPENFSYHDISPLVSPRIGVFPGDTAFSRDIALDFSQGSNFLLSRITTTLHLGAHTDAPNHYDVDGVGMSDRTLSFYLGLAQVIDVDVPRASRIFSDALKDKKILAPRILFKTKSFPNPDEWNSDFAALSAELIYFLSDQGVKLVGIDTPSIDPQDCKKLESHSAVQERKMAILEGIVLNDVPEGLYTLIALPLKIEDADASPVRAILLNNL